MGKLKEILCFCFCCGEKNASRDFENLNSSLNSETDRSVENQQRIIKRSIGVQAEITVTHPSNASSTNHLNEKSNDTINISYKLGTKITNFDGIDYFKGNFVKRTVTIKRILHSHYNKNEIERLKILDDHENILRYFNTFKDNSYYYILMDEFGVSLEHCVFNKIIQIAGQEENLMQQLTSVVGFIHKKDIFSLNLNVFNVRVVFKNGRSLIKLLNFHNSQSLNGNKIRFSRAPGMLSDIYDLGCIFFFVLSKRHNLKEETTNLGICNMIVCILQSFENSNKTWKNVLCIDMIKRMMKPNENERPNINEIKSHPYFWEVDKIAKMIINVSKMFEDNNGSNQDFKMKLERNKKQVIGGNWKSKIDNEILEEICKHRMYDGQKLYQLVQAIRNILVHQTSPVIADNMGTTIEDILEYWLKKFPKLVVHLWQVAKDHNLL